MATFDNFEELQESQLIPERKFPISCPKITILIVLIFMTLLFVVGCIFYFTTSSSNSQIKIGGIGWPFFEKVEENWNFEENNLNRGPNSFPVPVRLFSLNRERLCKELEKLDVPEKSFVLLEGGQESTHLRYHTHLEISPFRQESYFVWTFGVEEAGFVGAIDVDTCKSILFAPELGTTKLSYWTGRNFTKENLIAKYGVDEIDEVVNLEKFLNESGASTLLLLDSLHAYSYRWMRQSADSKILAKLAEKGSNAAIFHYGSAEKPSNRRMEDGDLCLIDMGAEYFCYGSDLTRTIPVNGKYTKKQKLIYDAVLNATRAAQAAAKPGVWWIHLVNVAHTALLYHLKEGGLLKGDLESMFNAGVGEVFMPHGLGHQLGLDVHDVEIWHREILENATERVAGTLGVEKTRILSAGMYVTIEPGCYFIDSVINAAYNKNETAPFLVKERIEEYRGFGGIRIEDDFLITDSGVEKFNDLPTTTEEIEEFMKNSRNNP